MKELKIFELTWAKAGEKEWVCAHTNVEALKTYFNITGTYITDLDDEDEIVEIPKDKWHQYALRDSDSDPEITKTFKEIMKTKTVADIIGGTMY